MKIRDIKKGWGIILSLLLFSFNFIWEPILALVLEVELLFTWKVPVLALLFQLPLVFSTREVLALELSVSLLPHRTHTKVLLV